MPPELTTIAGTLAAALVAGLLSYWAGRSVKTHEWMLSLARDELSSRKALFVGFLAEAQRLVILATQEKIQKVDALDKLNHQYAEILIQASAPVRDAAKHVFDAVLEVHTQARTVQESKLPFHPRKEAFVEAARAELDSYREA